ncbi:MAG TPA: RNA polymerase subunit sigma-70 [Kofleriaceae bacterium]|nr:RNA polymerase subunit sigma-70 [Kofleriaceae bacterium]
MTDANASMDLGAALEPLRPGLRLHCYRMLGSSHDSDDMVQEAMLRAWRARGSLEDPARVKPWLYRIATNACLDELRSRSRRGLAVDIAAPVPGNSFPPAAPIEDAAWLEPMHDGWLAGCGDDPEARYTLRESVALAFVAALQVLSPAQRATLLLRDVVGLSAEETAAALEQSVSAANSVLHRARAALEDKALHRDPAAFAAAPAEPVLERYMRALEAHDIDAMIALLHDEVHTTMPPSPTWIAGYADNAVFYRHMFARWGDEPIRLVPIGVNGGAGFEFHRAGVVRAIEAAEVRDGKIFRMHHFMQPAVVALFTAPSR